MNAPLLDIYVNHWTEGWEIGEKAFRMLALQRGVDWEKIRVTVVHDGSPAFPDTYFEGLPFAVRQVELMHGGIAKARNWCIDDGDGEWIKWCDWDDMFCSVYGLKDLTHALEIGQDYDLLWFDVMFELLDGRVIRKNTYDPVVVHGKAIRREWLREHRIRFPEHLTWCEDSAMLAVCEMEIDGKRKGYIRTDAPIYSYIERRGSLCNRPEILFANRKSFFARHCYVQAEMEKRGLMREARMMTARNLGDAMYTLEIAEITDDMTEFREKVRDYYRARRKDLTKVTSGEMREVLRAVNLEDRCHIEAREFWDWLRRLNDGEQGGSDCLCMT